MVFSRLTKMIICFVDLNDLLIRLHSIFEFHLIVIQGCNLLALTL